MLENNCSPQEAKDFLEGRGVGIVLKSQEITYRKPVVFPDTLTVAIHNPEEHGNFYFNAI
jgi:acyl-CoA thioesterase FadM